MACLKESWSWKCHLPFPTLVNITSLIFQIQTSNLTLLPRLAWLHWTFQIFGLGWYSSDIHKRKYFNTRNKKFKCCLLFILLFNERCGFSCINSQTGTVLQSFILLITLEDDQVKQIFLTLFIWWNHIIIICYEMLRNASDEGFCITQDWLIAPISCLMWSMMSTDNCYVVNEW